MRIAVVSDIHGNRTALEAVLKDLKQTSPDLVLHGGDLADFGSSPVEVLDQIRDLGWPGITGNTDEMLYRPESLMEFASKSPGLEKLFSLLDQLAVATREVLGQERLSWLSRLPRVHLQDSLALVHATPESLWRAPSADADNSELLSTYGRLQQPIVVYGHIHRPYIRNVPGLLVVNTGSVGLPYDGDPRASYLLLDNSRPSVCRVEYDINREIQLLMLTGRPGAEWIARSLTSATPQMPD